MPPCPEWLSDYSGCYRRWRRASDLAPDARPAVRVIFRLALHVPPHPGVGVEDGRRFALAGSENAARRGGKGSFWVRREILKPPPRAGGFEGEKRRFWGCFGPFSRREGGILRFSSAPRIGWTAKAGG